MSEQELNSYRFNSGQEPSDEMLQAIMEDARDAAVKKAKEAKIKFAAEYERLYEQALQIWGDRIEAVKKAF